ncbi:Glucanosyltransferase-domain-containing protein [Kalaharituber pfeilii]|nr:Glucanosyltransferase-domain-containing protein [Kalaharituber pfeilii]
MAYTRLFTILVFHALALTAVAVNPIMIKGNHFLDSVTNERFVIVGLAYQPNGEAGYDPRSGRDTLTDAKACLRDATSMQKLGINTIRVYNLNPYLNHDLCVSTFNAAGIYLALDVNSPFPGESINRLKPHESYHSGKCYLTRITSMVDAFMNYPNLLLFFAGNEVVNDVRSAKVSPPYMRAVQRDLKQYVRNHANRTIPIGYSASDDPLRLAMHRYLSCGDDEDSRADFFGLNSYQWCHGSDWGTSGYQRLVDNYYETPIPIFFSEYGCNTRRPRSFSEVGVLYGERMASVWSGGIIYEYTEERSGYGLVKLNRNGDVSLSKEYDNLRTQYNAINFTRIGEYEPTVQLPVVCSASEILDRDAVKNKFNFSFDLPPNPAPHIIHKNYTAKNKNTGGLVKLNSLVSPYKIFSSSGTEITNMELKVLVDTPNEPEGNNETESESQDQAPDNQSNADIGIFQPSSSLGILILLVYLFFNQ